MATNPKLGHDRVEEPGTPDLFTLVLGEDQDQ